MFSPHWEGEGKQGCPLKPRQGPSPCTLLSARYLHHSGPDYTVFHLVAFAVDFGYGVGVVVAGAVVVEGDGFVEVGVEGLAEGFDRLYAFLFEDGVELAGDQLNAVDPLVVLALLLGYGREGAVEVVYHGQELHDEVGGG